MNCSFCSVTAFNGRRFRRRPLDAVIEELKKIPQKMVVLTDDNIVGYGQQDRDWAYAFFSRIVEEGIKKYFFTTTMISTITRFMYLLSASSKKYFYQDLFHNQVLFHYSNHVLNLLVFLLLPVYHPNSILQIPSANYYEVLLVVFFSFSLHIPS